MLDLSGFRKLLIYGGSFDPPHVGHVALPGAVARRVGADVVVYVPAGRAPHKLERRQTDAAERLAMLRIALAEAEAEAGVGVAGGEGQEVPRVATRVLEDEVRRAGDGRPSYTVDTLSRLRPRLGAGAEMRLLIGMDQVSIFESWKDWRRVVELAEPLVMRRPGEAEAASLSAAWRARVVEVPTMAVSSSEVRRRVAAGESLKGLVSRGVARYIEERGLYRADESGVVGDGGAVD